MVSPVSSPDSLDFAPERLVPSTPRGSVLRRLGIAGIDGLLSLALNAAVIGWLAEVGWPLRPAEAPAPVSVEIVDHMPGEGGAAKTAGGPAAQPGSAGPTKPRDEAKQARAETAPATPAEQAQADPTASKPPPTPAPVQREPAPEPESADAAPPVAPEPPEKPADSAETAAPRQSAEPPTPAVPPPPEHPDNTAEPHLVEAPKPPAPTLPQPPTANPAPSAPPAPVAEADARNPGPAPEQPDIVASRNGDDTIAPDAPKPETPPALTAEQKRQAETTAKLAAVLPFSTMGSADPFQSRLNGNGQSAAQSYRGAVYGNFAKANDLVAEARATHMRGQAVVAFSIDDQGRLANLAIAVSSGNPDLDQTALELIRRSAPFPPPPPGAQRTFSPAIGFGLDE